MSGVRMQHLKKRLMTIHSNPPTLYYGFKQRSLTVWLCFRTATYTTATSKSMMHEIIVQLLFCATALVSMINI